MNSRFIRFLQFALLFLDLAMINIVLFAGGDILNSSDFVNNAKGLYTAPLLNFVWLTSAAILGVYKKKYVTSLQLFVKQSVLCFAYFLVPVLCFATLFKKYIPVEIPLAVLFVSAATALLINRCVYVLIANYNREFLERVVVIGFNDVSKKVIKFFEENKFNRKVIGVWEELDNVQEVPDYPLLSNIRDAIDFCKKFNVTEIYSSIAPDSNVEVHKLVQHADQNCIHFKILPNKSLVVNHIGHLSYIDDDIPVISLWKQPLADDLINRVVKRSFDIAFSSLVLLLVLSWLIPLVGLLVWIDSKGPIFFIQPRSGKANSNFSCIKFRSMKVNELADKKQATRNDERLTKVGKFLRRTNLDEFPQFLNVLKGDMSIVGPRPHMLKHTEEFSQMNSQYMIRHFLKPGITGWAQVNGYRGPIASVEDLKRRIEHDIWYLENWCMWLDIKIIFRTIANTFKGEKNAF